jgi:hypothetical protein
LTSPAGPQSGKENFFSGLLNRIKPDPDSSEAASQHFCDHFETKLMRIVSRPEQDQKSEPSHNFCGFVVSGENEGLTGFVKMSKIFRQNEHSGNGRFPPIKIHFVDNILAGNFFYFFVR